MSHFILTGVKNMYFEPVVSLPKVTDLRTGEEDCDVLFCQRARLYRLTDKQWKERGIGEMKLLRNRKTGQRLLWFNIYISQVADYLFSLSFCTFL